MKTVDIIVSGYEFICPYCKAPRDIIAIPKRGKIECYDCGKISVINSIFDARD